MRFLITEKTTIGKVKSRRRIFYRIFQKSCYRLFQYAIAHALL